MKTTFSSCSTLSTVGLLSQLHRNDRFRRFHFRLAEAHLEWIGKIALTGTGQADRIREFHAGLPKGHTGTAEKIPGREDAEYSV